MIKQLTVEDFDRENPRMGILAGFTKESKVWGEGDNREYTLERYRGIIRNGGLFMLAYGEEGEIQGGLGAIKAEDLHDGTLYAVETFWFVHPQYRKLGIGVDLLNAFEAWAKAEGCKKVAMVHLVDSYPEVLKKFYEGVGYKLIELHYAKDL